MSQAVDQTAPFVPTPAYRQAVDASSARVTPPDAFAAARRIYLTGQKLDMNQLAARLGIARATLYRWAGDRDRLLADVIFSAYDQVFQDAKSRAGGTGAARLVAILQAISDAIADATAVRAFLAHEGQAGLKLLMNPAAGVHGRIVEAITGLISEEQDAGHYRPPVQPAILADALVSLGEHFLYSNFVSEYQPQREQAKEALRLLLREDPE